MQSRPSLTPITPPGTRLRFGLNNARADQGRAVSLFFRRSPVRLDPVSWKPRTDDVQPE